MRLSGKMKRANKKATAVSAADAPLEAAVEEVDLAAAEEDFNARNT